MIFACFGPKIRNFYGTVAVRRERYVFFSPVCKIIRIVEPKKHSLSFFSQRLNGQIELICVGDQQTDFSFKIALVSFNRKGSGC